MFQHCIKEYAKWNPTKVSFLSVMAHMHSNSQLKLCKLSEGFCCNEGVLILSRCSLSVYNLFKI